MKKIINLIVIMFTVPTVGAQITYPSTDFAIAGDTFRISVAKLDSLDGYNFQLTGANYVWNYSQLEPQSQYIDQYITPNSSGYRLSFISECIAAGGNTPLCNSQWNATSNLAHVLPDSVVFGPFKFSNQVQLYEKTTSVLTQNLFGMSLGLNNITYPMTVKYTVPDTVYRFPLAYGNRDSCNSSYTMDLSNLGINFQYKVTSKRVNNVQGWGAITTPYGYFASTIKLYTIVVNSDTMTYNNSVIPIPTDTNIIFSWFAASKARPLMQVTGLLTNGTLHYTDVEYIDTVRCITPLASFTKSPLAPYIDSATNNVSVTFNNTSNNSSTFEWNFGDTASGNLNTSTQVNPNHTYDTSGIYKVTLIACNSVCSPLQCDTIILPVTIFDSSNVQAAFTYLPLQPCTSDTVKFTNTSLNASVYNWNFGNGTTSTLKSPQTVYGTPGSYTVTLIVSGDGVSDTTTSLVVIEAPPLASISPSGSVALCTGDTIVLTASGGDTYRWSTGSVGGSIKVSSSGSYYVTAYNNCGNSTSQAVTVTAGVSATPSISITALPGNSVCAGTAVNLTATITNGGASPLYQWYKNGALSASNNSTYAISTPVNSDSVWCILTSSATCVSPLTTTSNKIKLTVKQPSAFSYSYAVCLGSSYSFNGAILTQAGTYHDTLTSANGCDSITTLTLTINVNAAYTINTAICAGSSYNFNGTILTQAGTYHDTLLSANGCDSVITLDLTVNANAAHSINAAICAGSSYNFNGTILTQAGTYHDTLPFANGCDSVITLDLRVNANAAHTINAAICAGSSYNFNGTILTQTGAYHDTLPSANGCDSVITLDLTVNANAAHTINAAICAGSSYNFNGTILTLAGTYHDTLPAANGCDSIITLDLTVNANAAHGINTAICAGSSYNFNGMSITQSGTYHDTLTSANGCDSVLTLTLSVNNPVSHIINASICTGSSYNFNGTQETQTAIYYDTLTAYTGCDSLVILHLSVNAILKDTETIILCAGDTFDFEGISLTQGGTFRDTLTAIGGCDSVFTLNLIIQPALHDTLYRSICQGNLYDFNGQSVSNAGAYSDTITALSGCDSVVTLILTVLPQALNTINDSICAGSSYNFNGRLITQSGMYIDTLQSANTCDSIITLRLYVLPSPLPFVSINSMDSLITDTVYSSYQWLLNDSTIEGANDQLFIALQNGSYRVAVTGFNGCSDTSAAFNVIGLSVSNINGNTKVSVWPNPSQGIFTIIGLDKGETIEVYNYLSQKINRFTTNGLIYQLDISDQANGVYFIEVINIDGTIAVGKKIVKAN